MAAPAAAVSPKKTFLTGQGWQTRDRGPRSPAAPELMSPEAVLEQKHTVPFVWPFLAHSHGILPSSMCLFAPNLKPTEENKSPAPRRLLGFDTDTHIFFQKWGLEGRDRGWGQGTPYCSRNASGAAAKESGLRGAQGVKEQLPVAHSQAYPQLSTLTYTLASESPEPHSNLQREQGDKPGRLKSC